MIRYKRVIILKIDYVFKSITKKITDKIAMLNKEIESIDLDKNIFDSGLQYSIIKSEMIGLNEALLIVNDEWIKMKFDKMAAEDEKKQISDKKNKR